MASIVMSYSFDLGVEDVHLALNLDTSFDEGSGFDVEYVKAMVPFADLFNADAERKNVSSIICTALFNTKIYSANSSNQQGFWR